MNEIAGDFLEMKRDIAIKADNPIMGLILNLIYAHRAKDGFAYINKDEFIKTYNITSYQFSKNIKLAIEKGYLEREIRRSGKANKYYYRVLI